jgi:hypothetical protein
MVDYLCRMRLMLSFILFPVFFIAPSGSKAGNTSKHRGSIESIRLENAALLKDFVAPEPAAIITPSVHSQSGNAKYREHSFTNFISAVTFSSNLPFAVITKLFTDPYHYHQPIALKLIFPEHYFW